jgi:hypothetical protein
MDNHSTGKNRRKREKRFEKSNETTLPSTPLSPDFKFTSFTFNGVSRDGIGCAETIAGCRPLIDTDLKTRSVRVLRY